MFRDRREAGDRLADRLREYRGDRSVIVLALPRGGVVPGFEIARQLNAPLDVLIVRKIGAPWQPELAAGAVSETGTVVINRSVVSGYGITEEYLRKEIEKQKKEIARRVDLYREGRSIAGLKGKTIILVDDGVATGATMKAALEALGHEKTRKVVVALPVAPPDTAEELQGMADEFICLETPAEFMAVGNYYRDFTQVTDDEVVALLRIAQEEIKEWT